MAVGGDWRTGASTVATFDGTSWSVYDTGMWTSLSLVDLWGTSDDDVFAIGGRGPVLHFDGVEWTEMEFDFFDYLHGIWGSSRSEVYIVG